MAKAVTPLQSDIREQMRVRGLSMRQLAEQMETTIATLSRTLKEDDPQAPSVEFLIKYAKATGRDIRDVILLVSPDEVVHGSGTTATILAARLARLKDTDRQLIENFISGALSKLSESDK